MKVNFVNPEAFEHWDYRNPDSVGIGNSETNSIEQAQRQAARGHEVTVYGPIAAGCEPIHKGVTWRHLRSAEEPMGAGEPGVWIVYRHPKTLDKLVGPEAGQRIWLVCQDEDYPGQITPERAAKLERVVTLCHGQYHHWRSRYPFLADKVVRSSNGLRPELVRETLAQGIPRDPYRLIYASSPDRALEPLVRVFTRAREFVPELSLHVYYGLDNIEKIEKQADSLLNDPVDGPAARRLHRRFQKIRALLAVDGVVFHGRCNQPKLYREMARSGFSVYPCSHFRETGFVAGMEAQALGCVPIWNGPWATEEHILHGVFIDGDVWRDPLVQARAVANLVALAQDEETREQIRADCMRDALERFSLEKFADQWSAWINDPSATHEIP